MATIPETAGRRVGVPTLPSPDTKSTPAEREKNTGRNIFLVGGGLVIAGLGAYTVYETVPAVNQAVHRMVDKAFLGHLSGDQLVSTDVATKPVERFNPIARTGEVKPTMITRIPEEQMQALNSLTKINDGNNTLQGVYPLETSTSGKPDTKTKFKRANNGSGNEQDRANRAEKGFLNIVSFDNIPAGSTILAPVDGRLTLFTASGNPTPLSDHDFITAVIDFQVEGKEIIMVISGGSTKGGMMNSRIDVFKPLTNAPVVGYSMPLQEQLRIRKEAVPVKKGTRILVADTEIDAVFYISGNLIPTGEKIIVDGKELDLFEEGRTNFQFFLSPDGRLIMPE